MPRHFVGRPQGSVQAHPDFIVAHFTFLTGFIAALLATCTANAQTFNGSGAISVLAGNSLTNAAPTDSIGCLDAHGFLTLDDCAVCTRSDEYPYAVSTSAGNCTFFNSSTPENTDSAYASLQHAFTCSPDWTTTVTDAPYTVNGPPYPLLCTGDVDCYCDVKTEPTAETDKEFVRRHVWGSQQLGITPGHIQALWLWEPASSS